MTMKYNWQQPDWPNFRFDLKNLYSRLLAIEEQAGFIRGKIESLDKESKTEAMIDLMVEEAIRTSEIEGEHLNRPDVRSSIRNVLGVNSKPIKVHDRRAQGIIDLLFDVRKTFDQELTQDKLFDWHLMLLASTYNTNLRVGYWRTDEEPMEVVSGHYGQWVVHYTAPPSNQIPAEMAQFIDWFNRTAPGKPMAIEFVVVRAAIAHLYFESIHPFDDGNGRIGRAIAEKALSQGHQHPIIFSLSSAIEKEKKAYYKALNLASSSNEITSWLHYFTDVVSKAQKHAIAQIDFILKKAQFFDWVTPLINERQLKVLERMVKAGIDGFEGGMNARKYIIIAHTSKATATRDLQHLHSIGALHQVGSGRSVHYELNFGRK